MNCLTIRTLAETFGSGDLQWLKEETDQYIRLHFEELRNMNSGKNATFFNSTQVHVECDSTIFVAIRLV